MPSEKKENFVLKPKDYKINGNDLRAFYDKHGKLVFVLDSTVNKIKPNVLLVMASRGDRKWDDVLANDYGMDLELVRPKKDNKYQKLDIEYDGLVVYDNLIREYTDGGDLKKALKDLEDFRAASSRRSATERLAVATAVAENARETIERTGDTIVELQAKIKATRSKITSLRRNVGREPTKQSAAKILKAEAQLEALNSKLARAKKRLENANKRLLVAEEDMAAARSVLDLVPETKENKKVESTPVVAPVDVQEDVAEPVEEVNDDEHVDEVIEDTNPDEEDDYNDKFDESDVKPLFDKDPNILDDKIAFKPISFDENIVQEENKETEEHLDMDVSKEPDIDTLKEPDNVAVEKDVDSAPALSFAPPKAIMDVVQVPTDEDNNNDDVQFDDVFSNAADNVVDDEVVDEYKTSTEHVETTEKVEEPVLNSLQSVDDVNTETILEKDDKITEIVAPENATSSLADDDSVEIKDDGPVVVSAQENIVRPVSPIRPPVINTNVPKVETQQHKPSLMYYVLLLVLIALSVFTLWLYQRSNVSVDAVPELVSHDTVTDDTVQESNVVTAAPVPVKVADEPVSQEEPDDNDSNPFVASAQEPETQSGGESVMGKIVEGSLDKIAKAADNEPVAEVPDEEPKDVQEDETKTPVVVNKPEYNVTQEKVFTTDELDIVGGSLCDGDVAPDANGCCPGETYSNVAGQNVCCPDDGGDCFPPMF